MGSWDSFKSKHGVTDFITLEDGGDPPLLWSRKTRVFVISPHKTGTSSLRHALNTLGFNCSAFFTHNKNHDLNWWKKELADPAYSIQLVKDGEFTAFQDTPWWIIYPRIDTEFPFSKFIFIDRDVDSWFKSVEMWFTNGVGTGRTHAAFEIIYGAQQPTRDLWTKKYALHRESVFNYFKDRPDDLLVIDIKDLKKNGYKNICKLVSIDWPKICGGDDDDAWQFPHINQGKWRK